MAVKNVLKPIHLIQAGDMSGNLTSNPVAIGWLDQVAVQFNFTGTPTGTFQVQGSVDYEVNESGAVINAGNWTSVTLSPSPTAAGSPDVILIDMSQLSFPYLRVQYTAMSGTGTLNAYLSAKEI